MKTLSILSQKGGTGKTMIATHLSVEAERHGHTVVLIDLDPQVSAANWSDYRQADTPAVIATPAARLKFWLEEAHANGATLAIIDTPPSIEIPAREAARAASFVLIPCLPSRTDIEANELTISLVEMAKVPARIVLNGVTANSDLGIEARKSMKNYDVPCAPCQIGRRVGFTHAHNNGLTVQELEPTSKATREVQTLYRYLAKEMEL